MAKFLGAIVNAGVAGAIIWALGQTRRKAGDEGEQFIVIPASSGNKAEDRGRNAIFGLIDIIGGGITRTPTASVPGGSSTSSATVSAGGLSALKRLIQSKEGGVGGYDTVYGGSKVRPKKPLTQMTVAEVRDWQDRSVGAGSASSAAGAYQIIRKTLDACIRAGAVSRTQRFDARAQEACGDYLLNLRGLNKYLAGSMSDTQFAQNLSKEWASLPAITVDKKGRTARGQSYYAGDGLNSSHHSVGEVLAAVRGLK